MRNSLTLLCEPGSQFLKEEAVDAGGVAREWFLQLSRALFNPDYALFKPSSSNQNVFQPNKESSIHPEHLQFFTFIGQFVGKAIWDGQLLDAYFTRSMYKHMLGVKPSYSDIESVDPSYYRSLLWMMENPVEGVIFQNFIWSANEFGKDVEVELKAGGRNIEVTDENKVWRVFCSLWR